MNDLPADSGVDDDREERLALLFDDLLERRRRGDAIELEAAVAEHPEFEADLRDLWAVAMVADEFGSGFTEERSRSAGHHRRRGHALSIPHGTIGDYELLEELGRGGMGIVFRARQRSLDRIVALKMLLHGEMTSPTNRARLRAEAEAAAQLKHPHIVPVHEVGEHDGQPFFSMEYVEGSTLARRLSEGPLPPRETAEILLAVCEAVAEAHRRGVLHRDLKPSNVLLDEDGRPFVGDFGLAKRFESADSDEFAATELTRSGDVIGTPSYMAPEQAGSRRAEIGPATDVYSLGAILYACLTGRPPFQAANPVGTLMMVVEQDPLPPRLLDRRADPDLEMIALKCLQKPIDLRYASAEAVAGDLRAYLNGEPISARSSRFSDVIVRWFRETHHAGVLENWGLLWMWHSLVLLVLCVLTNWWQWRGAENRLLYAGLWGIGLSIWAAIFWNLRRRSGPITFVERQIAHVWAGGVACSVLLYAIEGVLGLPVLTLSPVLALISGAGFLVKAGILTGSFYLQAVALFATGLAMAALQRIDPTHNLGLTLFGLVAGACFFVPGWKYHRQRRRAGR